MNIAQRDQTAIWHPFTQHEKSFPPFVITKGEGAYLFDEQGKRYLDLISSWWVNLHGHSHPDIAQAIYQQAMTLEHVIFSGFTHEPAVLLAEELLNILPKGMSKIFYSDNGSTAIEVALKMAYQYWRNQGEPRRQRFIAFKNGYHGDTFGAMSVGRQSNFFSQFDELLFEVSFFDYPETWQQDENIALKEEKILTEIEEYLNRFGRETAALIIEPLIQGSGGMRMCRSSFLYKLEQLIRRYHVLMIYDEVMTGFGRTGELFACIKANTVPDIICLAKGITGGFLPLAVTACRENIYQAFLADNFTQALAHGHSYTANPLGCSAGLASIKLLNHPKTQSQINKIEEIHKEMLTEFINNMSVEKIRYCGTIAAFDLQWTAEYGSQASINLRNRFIKQGLLIRPLGNTVYFLPPYCISEHELKYAYEVVAREIEGVFA